MFGGNVCSALMLNLPTANPALGRPLTFMLDRDVNELLVEQIQERLLSDLINLKHLFFTNSVSTGTKY